MPEAMKWMSHSAIKAKAVMTTEEIVEVTKYNRCMHDANFYKNEHVVISHE